MSETTEIPAPTPTETPAQAPAQPPAQPPCESPPPAPQPPLQPQPDPRGRLSQLAVELSRSQNRRLVIEYLRLRRAIA
jgi:hypothetical protein